MAHADTIDFDAPDEEFVAQLKANREFEDGLQPAIDGARVRIRRVDLLARRSQRRLPVTATPHLRARSRQPRRNVRSARRRARAPASSSGDDSPPEPPPSGSWNFLIFASRRMLAHELRREARWRRAAA
ncbi:MAG: hypothetical protein H0V20_05800 [Actinobacteria bacterium]|nr:hypothetical protein [Actinomycetota bacterium]